MVVRVGQAAFEKRPIRVARVPKDYLPVKSGLGQAAAAGIGARLLSAVLSGSAASTSRGLVFAVLVVAALSIGLLRMVEKVLAERLSQEYVHEVRLGLIRRNLADGQVKSLGIAVARTTNDLTSVKNWVSQGVAPLAVGIPLILGASAALAREGPPAGAAILACQARRRQLLSGRDQRPDLHRHRLVGSRERGRPTAPHRRGNRSRRPRGRGRVRTHTRRSCCVVGDEGDDAWWCTRARRARLLVLGARVVRPITRLRDDRRRRPFDV